MWSLDSTKIALGSANNDGRVLFWNIQDGKILSTYSAGPTKIDGGSLVRWSPNGQSLAVKLGNDVIQLITPQGKLLSELPDTYNDFAWSPDGNTLAADSLKDIQFWDFQGK